MKTHSSALFNVSPESLKLSSDLVYLLIGLGFLDFLGFFCFAFLFVCLFVNYNRILHLNHKANLGLIGFC